MKNIKKTMLVLLSFTLTGIFLSCQGKEKEQHTETQEESTEEIKPPSQIITNVEAKVLYSDYEKNVIMALEDEEARKKATRFVSYDFATIKQYIAYIEQEAKKANNTKIDSLRFYFGKYPNGKQKDKNTMFMVPTTQFKGDKYSKGFYIYNDGEGKLTAEPIQDEGKMGLTHDNTKKEYASFGAVITSTTMPASNESLTMNEGASGPPPTSDF